ncbi:MAG: hypothetical protein GY792_23725 [Gammaproteobacteria bacterium]|nr:hypothetical protein [Gammaproteobacteria bacterium]
MAKTRSGTRVAVQLDTRIALEAIILNRLQRIPANRRQEWLRGLLVQGFRQECQALRGTTDDRQQPAAMAFTPRTKGMMKTFLVNPVVAPNVPSPATGKADKPFAALGKVIG